MIFSPPTGFIARAGQLSPTIALLAAVALYPSIALGATFTVPLTGLDQPDGNNEFATADYDLNITFSHIESITLDFVMPDGYEGIYATTGNSTFSTSLEVVLHDLEDPILLGPLPLPILSPNAASQSINQVLPQISTHLSFGNTISICYPNGEYPEPPTPEWPNFILSGQGRLSFINVNVSSYHPLPSGTVVSSSTNLNSPGGVSEAYLTIVGTPVPEPSSLVILLSSVAFVSRYRNRKPNRT